MSSTVKKLVIIPEEEWERLNINSNRPVNGMKKMEIPLGKKGVQKGRGPSHESSHPTPPLPPPEGGGEEVNEMGVTAAPPPPSPHPHPQGKREGGEKGGGEDQKYVDRKEEDNTVTVQTNDEAWTPPGRRAAPKRKRTPAKKTWITL